MRCRLLCSPTNHDSRLRLRLCAHLFVHAHPHLRSRHAQQGVRRQVQGRGQNTGAHAAARPVVVQDLAANVAPVHFQDLAQRPPVLGLQLVHACLGWVGGSRKQRPLSRLGCQGSTAAAAAMAPPAAAWPASAGRGHVARAPPACPPRETCQPRRHPSAPRPPAEQERERYARGRNAQRAGEAGPRAIKRDSQLA